MSSTPTSENRMPGFAGGYVVAGVVMATLRGWRNPGGWISENNRHGVRTSQHSE